MPRVANRHAPWISPGMQIEPDKRAQSREHDHGNPFCASAFDSGELRGRDPSRAGNDPDAQTKTRPGQPDLAADTANEIAATRRASIRRSLPGNHDAIVGAPA